MHLRVENLPPADGFALFHLGFRPFFIGAASFSIFAVLAWMGIMVFGWNLPLQYPSPIVWHAHEMIFGYSAAVAAGFLLTATKNWTGQRTIHGARLASLFALWGTARILQFFPETVPLPVLAGIDTLFLAGLLIALLHPMITARYWDQYALLAKIGLLWGSHILFYLGLMGFVSQGLSWGLSLGFYLIIGLILTMGRRVIPFFIEKGVGHPVELPNWKWVDRSALALFPIFAIADTVSPNSVFVAILAGPLFVLHAIRLWCWWTSGIWQRSLLWVLYLGYGAITLGFWLKVSVVWLAVSPYLALHAFAFGGIGLMTMGMMARITLGHTGRNVLEPPPLLAWMFGILAVGALVRVLPPLFDQSSYRLWIGLSQLCWIIAFSLFLYVYAGMLTKARIDGQYG